MECPEPSAGRITEIREQVRDRSRVSLFIDGEFRLGLPRRIVEERGLRPEQHLDTAELQELETLGEVSRAVERGIRLLTFRPRSRSELRDRLGKKGHDEQTIEAAIAELTRMGYVDDEEFARYWVDNRQRHRPRGKRMLSAELRSKGLPKQIIEQTLDETEIDEYAGALTLARRRAEQLEGLDAQTRERRLTGYLQRRGFGWEAVRSALATLRTESNEESQ